MADAICSSLGSRSLTKSSLLISHCIAPKGFFVVPLVSFQHSVHTTRSRRRRSPLHFACLCTQNSSAFDVISTHEQSDGSFLFRFGDPSEVVKFDQLEETNLEVEGKGNKDENDLSVVEIIDSDYRRELTEKKIEGEEKSEASSAIVNGTNQLVESESRSVLEIESSSGETSSSSSIGVQVLVSGLSLDTCESSGLTEHVDDVLHRRGNVESNDSVGSDVEGFVHVDGDIDVNGSSGSYTQVENVVIGEDEGVSAETVRPSSGDNEEFISLDLNRVVEVNRDSDNIKEQLIRNDVDQREAWLTLSPSEHDSGPNDHESSAEIIESLTGRNPELVSSELDPVIEVPADNVGNEHSQEKIEVEHLSSNVDAANIEAETEHSTIGDSISKSENNETLSLSSPQEVKPALHEEGISDNVEGDIMSGKSEREVIETLPFSPPLEAEAVLVEERDSKYVEVKTQDDILGGSDDREVSGAFPSLPIGAEPVLDGGVPIGEVGSLNDIRGSSNESEGIGILPLSPSSETEPVPVEGGDTIGGVGSHNHVTGSNNEEIPTLNLSPPSEADPVLDEGGGKVAEAETQNDETEISSESELIGTLPLSPPLEAQSVFEEGSAEVVEAGTQNYVTGISTESEAIGALKLSLPFKAESILEERGAQVVESETKTHVLGISSESEAIGALPLSPPLEGQPILDQELGAQVVEAGTQNDVMECSSESEIIGTLPKSTPSEAESVLVEAGTRNDVTRVSNESETIGALPLFQPLEAEPILDEGDAEKVECGTENDIQGASSEMETILTLHPLTPLEVQPVPDNEEGLEETEIFNIATSSEILEVEVSKDIVGTDEPGDSSDSDKIIVQSEKIRLEKLFLSSGTASLPHPEKALAGGEDACFTCQNWLGVADGVSWWSLEGVDRGMYAHEVMEIAREIVSGCCDTPLTPPEEVLNLAIVQARNPGSSTVLISHFDGKDLHVANIGDSGVIVLRNGAVCQRSSPMFHEFNFPVLVEREDDPSKLVERYKFYLDEGDIVVAATDGLFDNLYEKEIISTVSKSLEADKSPKEIAEILAIRAHEVGSSTRTRSPFSDAAQAAGYTGWTGGRLDDVAVVVSLVKKGVDSQAS